MWSRTISYDTDSGRSNRLFIFVAIALVGVICVGVVLLGTMLLTRQSEREQAEAVAPAAQEPIAPPTDIPTNTPTASPTPTETPLPTPTGTLVVDPNKGEETPAEEENGGILPTPKDTLDPSEVTPTNTRVVPLNPTTIPEGTDAGMVTNPATGGTPPPDQQMPTGGGVTFGSNVYLAWVAIGVLFLMLVGLLVRLRTPSQML